LDVDIFRIPVPDPGFRDATSRHGWVNGDILF
jgi:hypothetical protein